MHFDKFHDLSTFQCWYVLPNVPSTKLNMKVDSQPHKKPKKTGGKGSVAAIGLRIPGYRAAEIQVDFTEEPNIFGTGACNSQKVHCAPKKFRKERVQRKV